jgi:hypothetical protein
VALSPPPLWTPACIPPGGTGERACLRGDERLRLGAHSLYLCTCVPFAARAPRSKRRACVRSACKPALEVAWQPHGVVLGIWRQATVVPPLPLCSDNARRAPWRAALC